LQCPTQERLRNNEQWIERGAEQRTGQNKPSGENPLEPLSGTFYIVYFK